MKEIKRQSSELPEMAKIGETRGDPNLIPTEDVTLLAKLGLIVGNRLKRGRYGVVYEGRFAETFSLSKLRDAAPVNGPAKNGEKPSTSSSGSGKSKKSISLKLHRLFLRPDRALQDDMRPGKRFALKFCDIETRRLFHIDDIEQRIAQELHFMRRVSYGPSVAIVRMFGSLATAATRCYVMMELADDNLQCMIAAYSKQNRLLPPRLVLREYESLVRTVRELHRQRLTYGMMRTSNILVFRDHHHADDKNDKNNDDGDDDSKTTKMQSFRLKIADFVRSVDMEATAAGAAGTSETSDTSSASTTIDDAIEEDLDDLFYLHYELFALSRFDFPKYQAFKESLKMLTEINAHRNSLATLDKVIELVRQFAAEQNHAA